MAELVESVKRHGIITPLTLAPDGDGFTIIAGERRYRAAKAAKLKQVPAQVRDADGEALTLAVAENVIRADLTPLEEARGVPAARRGARRRGEGGEARRPQRAADRRAARTAAAARGGAGAARARARCRSPARRCSSGSRSGSRCSPT